MFVYSFWLNNKLPFNDSQLKRHSSPSVAGSTGRYGLTKEARLLKKSFKKNSASWKGDRIRMLVRCGKVTGAAQHLVPGAKWSMRCKDGLWCVLWRILWNIWNCCLESDPVLLLLLMAISDCHINSKTISLQSCVILSSTALRELQADSFTHLLSSFWCETTFWVSYRD